MLSLQRLPSGDATSLGGSRVQGSLEHFSDRWEYGVGLLNSGVIDLVAHLRAAASAYATTNSGVAQTFAEDEHALAPAFAADARVDRAIHEAVAASWPTAKQAPKTPVRRIPAPHRGATGSGSGVEVIGGGGGAPHHGDPGVTVNDPTGAPITVHDPTAEPVTVNAPAGTPVHIVAPSGTDTTVQSPGTGHGTESIG
jgi:hypothetical protein